MRVWTLALVLALGCAGKDDDTDPTDTTDDTDIDIPDTFLGRTNKPSDVERTGTRISAGLLKVTVEGDGTWTVGDFLVGGKLSGTGNFGLVLPETAPAADVVPLDGGRTGALYLPIVFDDVNTDDVFADNADDLVLGFAADRWLVYLEAGSGDETLGWSVVNPADWTQYKLTEQAEVQLLGLSTTARIEGIYEGALDKVGVVAIDERALDGGGFADWSAMDVLASPESGQFDSTIDVRPPIDTFQFPDSPVRYVRAAAQLYTDDNDSGAYEAQSDTLLEQGLCYEGAPLVLRYSDTPRTIALAREIDRLGWITGWRFVTGPYGSSTEVGRSDLRWYRYGDDCAL
ncbi:MAG: hypothetical protein AB8H79_21735 [Myxococcota bacterium]